MRNLLLVIVALILGAQGATAAEVRFELLELQDKANSFVITEDGRHIAVACEAEGKIAVFDVATGKSVSVIECPSPCRIISRRNKLYVANGKAETITVISEENWTVEKTFNLGLGSVVALSAPVGEYFRDRIVAAAAKGCVEINVHSGNAIKIDGRMIQQSADGRVSPRQSHDYPPYHASSIFLRQSMSLYALRPEESPSIGAILLAPDVRRPVFYALFNDRLECRKLTPTQTIVGSHRLELPKWLKPYDPDYVPATRAQKPRLTWKVVVTSTTRKNHASLCHPLAVSHDEAVYMFLLDLAKRQVWRVIIPTFPDVPPPVVPEIPSGMPAMVSIDTPDYVTSFAITEDGTTLIAAHDAANLLSIWDVASGKFIRNVSCPSPRYVLCRGNRAFVANCAGGTITVVSTETWKAVDDIAVGEGELYFLSAPGGTFFRDRLLACTTNPAALYSVDIRAGKATKLADDRTGHVDFRNGRLAGFSYNGLFVLDYSGYSVRLFESKSYLSGKPTLIAGATSPSPEKMPIAVQQHNLPFWAGGAHIYSQGTLARLTENDNPALIAADVLKPVVYQIYADRIVGRKLQARPEVFTQVAVDADSFASTGYVQLAHEAKGNPDGFMHYNLGLTTIIPALSVTDGRSVRLFMVGHNDNRGILYRCAFEIESAEAQKFPELVRVGDKVVHQLVTPGKPDTCKLILGPAGMKVDDTGGINWTPQSQEIGAHQIKIRVECNGKTTFHRFAVEVRSGVAVAAAATTASAPHKHLLPDGPATLSYSADKRHLLVLSGSKLRRFDSEGRDELEVQDLGRIYDRIVDRPDYYLAFQDKSMFLIEKKGLRVRRKIDLAFPTVRKIVSHPILPISFAAVVNDAPAIRGTEKEKQIVSINETTGEVTSVPGAYGEFISIDPKGRFLYATLSNTYHKCFVLDNWGNIWEVGNRNDVLISYTVTGTKLRVLKVNEKSVWQADEVAVSEDGRRVICWGGIHAAVFEAADISRAPLLFEVDRVYTSRKWAIHPTSQLVVQHVDTKLKFWGADGKPAEPQIDLAGESLHKVEQLLFSASGDKLCAVYIDDGQRHLQSFFMKPPANEGSPQIATKTPNTSAGPASLVPPSGSGAEAGTAAGREAAVVERLECLTPAPAGDELTSQEIGAKYLNSVLLVRSGNASGTGVMVDGNGYILTCAHVITGGNVDVLYRTVERDKVSLLTVKATVIATDGPNDLALLKAELPQLPVVHLSGQRIETGEEITVIGHPAAGDQTLNYTLTTGIVSSIGRKIERLNYLQISAAVNPGSSGGPVFDSHGRLVGLVVLKARIEGAAFAIPADRLAAFLGGCLAKPPVSTEDARR